MTGHHKYNPFLYLFCLLYIIGFCFFYYKFVPLIKSFQIALIPILFTAFVLTVWREEWGILFFMFCFPLINNLPYFFGIYEDTPHAPTALILFLVFFMGWLIRRTFSPSPLNAYHPVFKPLFLFSLLVLVSGVITFFRFANYFPFRTDGIYEVVVNVNNVRAGGALMSDIFGCLNYLTGFLFFFVIYNTLKDKNFARKLLFVFSVSIFLSLIFSLIQIFYSIDIGNTPMWIYLDGITSTFKDTNSFGIVLSASLPLFMGLFLSSSKREKVFFFILIVFGLSVFPAIGSRSGFLAIGVSFLAFFLMFLFKVNVSSRRKILYSASFLLIILLLAFSYLTFFKESRLFKRIDSDIGVISDRRPVSNIFTLRLEYWKVASSMISHYPMTGVGMGAYIIELPNYIEALELPIADTDSAENYLFQVGSELGLIGLFLILWLFFEIFRQMIKSFKVFVSNKRERYIRLGVISALISIFVNFIFHSYIGNFEVKYFYWFLLFLVFTTPGGETAAKAVAGKMSKQFKWMAVFLLLVFGALHLWNSTHSLSINERNKVFGWEQNFGLYVEEKDDEGISFQWTKKRAGIEVKKLGEEMVIPIRASHPDIQTNPVRVRIFLADPNFRKRELIEETHLKNTGWERIESSLLGQGEEKIFLVLDTERTWQPLKLTGAPDPRSLGLGLGRIWFKYPRDLPAEKIRYIETISSLNWKGEQKASLLSNGVSRIRFHVEHKNFALRLSMKGQKAFNIGPFVVIRLNDNIIGKTLVDEEEWTNLVLVPQDYEGECVLSVEFTNDVYDADSGQDRNLFLGDLQLIHLK
jgi:O-antigen ligase